MNYILIGMTCFNNLAEVKLLMIVECSVIAA